MKKTLNRKVVAGTMLTLSALALDACSSNGTDDNANNTGDANNNASSDSKDLDTAVYENAEVANVAEEFLNFTFGKGLNSELEKIDAELTKDESDMTEEEAIDLYISAFEGFINIDTLTEEDKMALTENVETGMIMSYFTDGAYSFEVDSEKVAVSEDGTSADIAGSGISVIYDYESVAVKVDAGEFMYGGYVWWLCVKFNAGFCCHCNIFCDSTITDCQCVQEQDESCCP